MAKKPAGDARSTKKASTARTASTSPRRLKQAPRKRGQFWKRPKHPGHLSSVWVLAKTSAQLLYANWRPFLGIVTVYGVLSLLLVHGLSSTADVGSLKSQFDKAFTGNIGHIASGVGIVLVLAGSSGSGSANTAGVYQIFITIIVSLAVIRALRQVVAGHAIRTKDAYYQGMYPLVPFILVLAVCAFQLVPLAIGSAIYSLVTTNDIATLAIEKFAALLLNLGLAFWSFYMLSSSLFALYIVTLPDMTPLKALRSAKELVRYRQLTVLRKVACLPIVLMIIAAIIMVPIIILLTPLAQWVFFALTMVALAVVHTYIYTLYRELINE